MLKLSQCKILLRNIVGERKEIKKDNIFNVMGEIINSYNS